MRGVRTFSFVVNPLNPKTLVNSALINVFIAEVKWEKSGEKAGEFTNSALTVGAPVGKVAPQNYG